MPGIEHTPQRTPEITREFKQLEERMGNFEVALNVLADRLTPALSQPCQTNNPEAVDTQSSCRMAMQLREISNTVARWQTGVEDVCRRLEF